MNLQRLFDYDQWANREEAARLAAHPHARGSALLAHVIAAESLWLSRLRGEPPRMAVWPELDDFTGELDALRAEWAAYLPAAPLEASVSYTNSKGESFTSRVDDILMHVLLHGSYHRGQIATVLRGEDIEPAYTDYIHCVRTGALEGITNR